MPALPLTPAQLDDAARLKQRFVEWQKRQKDAGQPASQEAAGELLGFNQSALSQYLNGRIPLNVGAATRFASVMGCAVADFSPRLQEQLSDYVSAAMPDGAAANDGVLAGLRRVVVSDDTDTVGVRLVTLKLRAGVSRFGTEPVVEDGGSIRIPRVDLERGKLNADKLIAIQVRGQSMEPLMFEDDVIVIDPTDKKLVNRELYALNFDGDCCVKQMVKRNGEWYLHSVNPDFGPVNARSGEFSVIGRVVYQPGRSLRGRL